MDAWQFNASNALRGEPAFCSLSHTHSRHWCGDLNLNYQDVVREILRPAKGIGQPQLLNSRARCFEKPRRSNNHRKAPRSGDRHVQPVSRVQEFDLPGRSSPDEVAIEISTTAASCP